MSAQPKIWNVRITEPRIGRKAPVLRSYLVVATGSDDALAAFDDEMGAHQREGCSVCVVPYDFRVAKVQA